jgi:hypothetical protein
VQHDSLDGRETVNKMCNFADAVGLVFKPHSFPLYPITRGGPRPDDGEELASAVIFMGPVEMTDL